MNTLKNIEYYSDHPLWRNAGALCKFLLYCASIKMITPKLADFMSYHFSIDFEYVDDYGWCVYSEKPYNEMYFGKKGDLILTEINWDEIFWGFLNIVKGCEDDTYYDLVEVDGKLRLTHEEGGFNIMQEATIGFICYCLDIPISCHITKYDLRWNLIEIHKIFSDLLEAFQELDNIEPGSKRFDLADSKEHRYLLTIKPV